MILILTQGSDQSTNDVIEWLLRWGKPFLRINETDIVKIKSIQINSTFEDICFSLNNNPKLFQISSFKAYWYRRGWLNIEANLILELDFFDREVNKYLKEEMSKISSYFYFLINKIPNRIGGFHEQNNKLINLSIALQSGLQIPFTKIITHKEDIPQELTVVSKAISNNIDVYREDFSVHTLTALLNPSTIEDNHYFPSLVQGYVDKIFDLRIFYLNKRLWSMAILSQSDDTTKIDFRNYNLQKGNRVEPYNIPKKIERKVIKFMQKINWASGSIDFVVDKDYNYYFLEVNPIGQFGMVSFPCGYNIEKEIAKQLINNIDE